MITYVIVDDENNPKFLKIGHTTDLNQRLSDIRTKATRPDKTNTTVKYKCPNASIICSYTDTLFGKNTLIEQCLHYYYRERSIGNEWFEIKDNIVPNKINIDYIIASEQKRYGDPLYHHSKIQLVDINNIELMTGNPPSRTQLEGNPELVKLANSIRECGTIYPILLFVDPKNPSKFKVCEGNRRFLANKIIGSKTIPAMITNDTNIAKLYAHTNAFVCKHTSSEKLFSYLQDNNLVINIDDKKYQTLISQWSLSILKRLANRNIPPSIFGEINQLYKIAEEMGLKNVPTKRYVAIKFIRDPVYKTLAQGLRKERKALKKEAIKLHLYSLGFK